MAAPNMMFEADRSSGEPTDGPIRILHIEDSFPARPRGLYMRVVGLVILFFAFLQLSILDLSASAITSFIK